MKKLLLLSFLICSCNCNIVFVEKKIFIGGNSKELTTKGSTLEDLLKGNNQKADADLTIPALP